MKFWKCVRSIKKVDYLLLKEEKFELKDFFRNLSLAESRTMFAIKTNMVRAKMNYMSDKNYAHDMWKCNECNMQCSTEHIKVCPKYRHLRTNIDWENDGMIVKYFQQVIKLREDADNTLKNNIYST